MWLIFWLLLWVKVSPKRATPCGLLESGHPQFGQKLHELWQIKIFH